MMQRCRGFQLTRIILLLLSFFHVFSLCAEETPKRGGSLTVGLHGDHLGFAFGGSGDYGTVGRQVSNLIMESLIYFRADGSHGPRLAKEWWSSDDRKEWTFKLREDVLFHDGSQFTAHDAAYYINLILDPETKSRLRNVISPIEKAIVKDDFSLVLKLKHPWPALLPILGLLYMPSRHAMQSSTHNLHPIGTGGFQFVSWKRQERLHVTRFDRHYAADKIYLDDVYFRVLPDDSTRFAALKAGEIDLMGTTSGAIINRGKKDPEIVVHTRDGGGGYLIILNTRNPPLDDPRVRAALAHAYDQRIGIKVSTQDTAHFITHPYGDQAECGDAGYRHYDPEKARALLKDYGKPVSLSMVIISIPLWQNFGELIQQLYKQVGVDVELVQLDRSTMIKHVLTQKYEASGWGYIDTADFGPQLTAINKSDSPYNVTGINDPILDKLVAAQRQENNPKKRIDYLCQLATRMNKSAHIQNIWGHRHHVLASPDVKNVPTLWKGIADATHIWLDR